MSFPGCSRSSLTTRTASASTTILGWSAGSSVRENTISRTPDRAAGAPPMRSIASNDLRPTRWVSNRAACPEKSMSGSIRIQSNSPPGPAM